MLHLKFEIIEGSMISNHKKSFTGVIHALSKPFLGVHPNILTLLSLFFSLLFFLSLVYHNYILSLLSFVGFVFDAIDGYVARERAKKVHLAPFWIQHWIGCQIFYSLPRLGTQDWYGGK